MDPHRTACQSVWRSVWHTFCAIAACAARALAASPSADDSTPLVQTAARSRSFDERSNFYGADRFADDFVLKSAGLDRTIAADHVKDTAEGPMALTELGWVRGAAERGYNVFRNVPYAHVPKRFARPVSAKPWKPQVLNAMHFGPGCIGSGTGVPESESCLNLNIWLPPGEHKSMPVVVYFHGGMNQHGSGQEPLRQGDLMVQSQDFPVIFINFDWRLGLFGWIYSFPVLGQNISNNLGLLDQQALLRWVKQHIASFGGDPERVTLQGQSEGAGIIFSHMVSPGSKGLFNRAIFHSPPAEIWSHDANKEHTAFAINKLGCEFSLDGPVNCLRRFSARALWETEFVPDMLARNVGSKTWHRNYDTMMQFAFGHNMNTFAGLVGWHPVIDGKIIPGDPRELISKGKWNKVPVLITVSKNESLGIFPGTANSITSTLGLMVNTLFRKEDKSRIIKEYGDTLRKSGINMPEGESARLWHEIITDKLWTCDLRSLAADIARTGGEAHLSMFWHAPKFDPVGGSTNRVCQHGATCHAAEMLFAMPQGRGQGIPSNMTDELEFASRYRDSILQFAYGETGPWVKYDVDTQAMTFYDTEGPWVVPGYRKEQCDVLDTSMGDVFPLFMKKRALKKSGKNTQPGRASSLQ